MGSKHGAVSVEQLLSDPLSKQQRQYIIKQWIGESNIFGEMEHTLVLVMVEYSGSTMEEKFKSASIPYKTNKSKTWRHAQLFKKGVVVNSPKQAIRSKTFKHLKTFNDFTYEISRVSEYQFWIKVLVGDAMNIIKYEFAKRSNPDL